jgi:hypothetical protein
VVHYPTNIVAGAPVAKLSKRPLHRQATPNAFPIDLAIYGVPFGRTFAYKPRLA